MRLLARNTPDSRRQDRIGGSSEISRTRSATWRPCRRGAFWPATDRIYQGGMVTPPAAPVTAQKNTARSPTV